MARVEKVDYFCDRCRKEIVEGTRRQLSFKKDESKLFEPKTWGSVSRQEFDVCDNCFDQFLSWLRKNNEE